MKLTFLATSLVICLSAGISTANENELLQALNHPVIKDLFLKSTKETLLSLVPDTLEDFIPLVGNTFGTLRLGQLDPGSRAVIIPPGLLPELFTLPSFNPPNPIDIGPGIIVGNISINNAQLEGLHTLTDTVAASVEPTGINANYTIVLPKFSLNSDYLVDLILTLPDIIDPIELRGEGISYLNLTNTALNVGLYITQRGGTDGVRFEIKLAFGIDLIDVFFENLVEPPIEDWTTVGEGLKGIIVLLVQGLLNEIKILNILTLLLEELTKECTFKEILDFVQEVEGADLSCVVIPWPPVRPTEPPVEVTEEPVSEKNGAYAIGFGNMMYLEILAIIAASYSAFMH